MVGFTGSFEPSNVATLQMHRRLGDAVVTEHDEGRYVAYFGGGDAGGEELAEEVRSSSGPRKRRKATKKGSARKKKSTPRGKR